MFHRLAGLLVVGVLLAGCGRVHETTLDNGLRVIVKEDHRSPTVVSQLWYRVGSVDEPDGLTGMSHVLEHMMFKGTARLKPNEFSRIVAEHGGRENAFTSYDYTAYHQQLARDRLEVAFELEADRMRNLALADAEFRKEIRVVMEERRLRTDDRPEALLDEKFMATAYTTHPYRHPVIGWMADLERLKTDDLRRWYERYYAPNNAILVVAGDVAPREVFALARKHFGAVPRREVSPTTIPAEPAQTAMRRTRIAVPAEVPHLALGWHVPVLRPGDRSTEPYALAVAAAVLDGGNAARFARELVRGQKIAASVGAGYSPAARGPTLFALEGTPAQGRRIAELEQALRAQVERLKTERVADAELARIKAQVVAAEVYGRDSVFYQAMQIGRLAAVGLDWRLMDEYVTRIKAVTADEVQAVARKYLTDANLTVGVLDPLPLKSGTRPRPVRAGGGHGR
jgi:zinc protease